MISLAVVVPIGKKKATYSKLETQIQSELRITNYEFSIISCCNSLKVAQTSRVVAAGISIYAKYSFKHTTNHCNPL
ncbi:hypothetical protein A6V25_14385 [Nostoc sp. ATCC 53789]|nr:hypothetical protein A6V25_14385 [Nostoc sp. ATCC 53789]